MPQTSKAALIEGMVDSVRFCLSDPERPYLLVKLFDAAEMVLIPGLHKIDVADRLRMVCVEHSGSSEARFQAIDFIHNEHSRPITKAQRDEQAKRVGLTRIYDTSGVECSSVLGKITEIEQQLIAYLVAHPEMMRQMHSDAFEKLVAEFLASNGFDVEWTGRTNNTGADVLAFKFDPGSGLVTNFLVECKRYSEDNPVGIEIARALYGAKCDENFSNALLATTSYFQKGVEQFAIKRWDFQLRDYDGLVEWLNRYDFRKDGRLHMEERALNRERYRRPKM